MLAGRKIYKNTFAKYEVIIEYLPAKSRYDRLMLFPPRTAPQRKMQSAKLKFSLFSNPFVSGRTSHAGRCLLSFFRAPKGRTKYNYYN